MSRLLASLALVFAVGCHAQRPPELRVLGARHEVVFVQVTNPANHVMKLDKLDYKFAAAAGGTVAQGELPLDAREIPAGAAVVVEIPLDGDDSAKALTMTGQLTAELDEIVRTFQVSAQVQPH